nr:synaptotagmin-3 [Columba livia]
MGTNACDEQGHLEIPARSAHTSGSGSITTLPIPLVTGGGVFPRAESIFWGPQVHRRTLNPVFEETFSFGVPFAELPSRRLHFSVYDFDRFSRHDLIGHVVLDNLLEAVERGADVPIWRDILEGPQEKAELGELNFSLCYLPTAGRLTVTVIRATNLRAMDLTGYSDPYVKASLMSEGRRLKKRKTSIKKNTLNPSYNEALVFDLPQDSVRLVGLTIAVMDYDCIGHNEVIGLCHVGPGAEPRGREHWERMLANPRKPVEQWHPLVEEKSLVTPRDKPGSALENVGPD